MKRHVTKPATPGWVPQRDEALFPWDELRDVTTCMQGH